jgi:3-oxoacyl-[acyl-carrier protein] reductase
MKVDLGGKVALAMDVTDAAPVDRVVAEIVRRFGSLDILVNNAGANTEKHRVTIEEFPLEEGDRLIKVDLTGLYLVSKAAAKVMVKRGILHQRPYPDRGWRLDRRVHSRFLTVAGDPAS